MESEILAFINAKIREEHGSTVTIDSAWTDADVDSYGSTMVFFELDEKYGCFDKNWLSEVKGSTLMVRDLVDRVINAG